MDYGRYCDMFYSRHSHGVYKPTDWRDDLWTTHVDYPAWWALAKNKKKELENRHAMGKLGKTHYFDWAMFNHFLSVYQRLPQSSVGWSGQCCAHRNAALWYQAEKAMASCSAAPSPHTGQTYVRDKHWQTLNLPECCLSPPQNANKQHKYHKKTQSINIYI